LLYKIRKKHANSRSISRCLLPLITLSLALSSCSINDSYDKNELQNNSATVEQVSENDMPKEEHEEFIEKKEVSWESEGVSYKETFRLVNNPNLPFVTYIPENGWTAESKEKSVILKQGEYGKIEIVFMDKEIDGKQASVDFEKLVKDAKLEKEEGEFPSWVISFYTKQIKVEQSWNHVYAILGKHSNQYFYIYRSLALEGAEAFIPIEHKIYEQWYWKDTKESLGSPF